MVLGSFGPVVFQVSDSKILTFDGFSWSTDTRWAEHARHGDDPLTEFVGNKNDRIKFKIELSAYAGVNPMDEIVTLLNMQRTGEAHCLVIGNHGYGKNRWVIEKMDDAVKTYDAHGDILTATVSLSLLAYPWR